MTKIKVHIRWMIRRDMPDVLAIENASHDFPWCEEDFLRHLRQRNVIGMVAERDDKILGFMVYELHQAKIVVMDFAVHPNFRRQTIGQQMINKLVGKLSSQRRSILEFMVRESQLPAQLFLRACGLKATEVIREHFPDSGEDGYRFLHSVAEGPAEFLASCENLTGGWA